MKNISKAIECLLITEDYEGLQELAKKCDAPFYGHDHIRENNISQLAATFQLLGMNSDAVNFHNSKFSFSLNLDIFNIFHSPFQAKLYSKHGMAKIGADGGPVGNLGWDIALQVSEQHQLSNNVSTLLLQCVR